MDGAQELEFKVTSQDAGTRLDLFLAQDRLNLSRSQIKKLIDGGSIKVNDRSTKSGHLLREGEIIRVILPHLRPMKASPESIPLNILYEDEFIIVVVKEAGLVVHPAPGNPSGTLVNALLHHCRNLSGIGGELRPGIVHRLDKGTSGIIVAAKTEEAHRGLAQQFKDHTISKKYKALVYGVPKTSEGTISKAIGRHPKERKKMSVHCRKGKEAITQWKVLQIFREVTLLDVKLKTGRTHQVRVHLSSIGHPILGDDVYMRKGKLNDLCPDIKEVVAKLKRQALHAYYLAFSHPVTGNCLEFEIPLPHDMEEVIQRLTKIKEKR